ncbi:sigma 54-interacting transcriptional regulator [Hazenella sp. IB182357]|uniref:HTH-type transcriptional regulatory protein TyrR n=1 Tax=Polycladospora coralii TaxID=2771432 RepID=A0A926NBN3_9BACL|nr:sigma 54-interacting transcriptional regulator [Polycladospora coralii]MBD1373612.1 sigma 54-interacting transcriptional regulator [Polycladospora coralii]
MILKIETIDRVGITYDVIKAIFSKQLDIIQMEVKPQFIYLNIGIEMRDKAQLISVIKKVPGVLEVQTEVFLPSERSKQQMDTILKTMSEGILLVDDRNLIQLVNRAAEKMLKQTAVQLYGKHLSKIGVYYTDEGAVISKNFLIQTHPLQEGEVIILRDFKHIRSLIRSAKQSGAVYFEDILHHSSEMSSCMDMAKRIAKGDATVFIYGESGTGKEMFAKAIHYESERTDGPFIPINCAAIPELLLESELFGYEEGAFTGASRGGKKGLIEQAQHGTLFLDEIGELPLHLQAKLLRVLEERKVRKVGGRQSKEIDIRVIAATNRNPITLVKQKKFREDLYYRLHVLPIQIPSLRARKEDIPLLVETFVNRICARLGRSELKISPAAMHQLLNHHWPGNVRELQNVLERSIYLCEDDSEELREVMIQQMIHEKRLSCSDKRSLKEEMAKFEKQLLSEALLQYKTARKVAQALQISHTAILKKLRKYELNLPNR